MEQSAIDTFQLILTSEKMLEIFLACALNPVVLLWAIEFEVQIFDLFPEEPQYLLDTLVGLSPLRFGVSNDRSVRDDFLWWRDNNLLRILDYWSLLIFNWWLPLVFSLVNVKENISIKLAFRGYHRFITPQTRVLLGSYTRPDRLSSSLYHTAQVRVWHKWKTLVWFGRNPH